MSQYKHRLSYSSVPQLLGLFCRRDGEAPDAGLGFEVPGYGHGSVAIGVGFDDGNHLRTLRQAAADIFQVLHDGVQIDGRIDAVIFFHCSFAAPHRRRRLPFPADVLSGSDGGKEPLAPLYFINYK